MTTARIGREWSLRGGNMEVIGMLTGWAKGAGS